jgi:hypothetical protein
MLLSSSIIIISSSSSGTGGSFDDDANAAALFNSNCFFSYSELLSIINKSTETSPVSINNRSSFDICLMITDTYINKYNKLIK